MTAHAKDEVRVYTDISIGKTIGVGIQAEGPFGRPLRLRSYAGVGFSPVEAELMAMFLGLEALDSLYESAPFVTSETTLFTDCESAIRALFDLGKFRSKITKALVKGLLNKIEDFKEKSKAPCVIRPIGSRENPAHILAREARKTWTDLLSFKAASSSPS